jgi:hypothetical protein
MGLEIEHILTIASGDANEDRAGAEPPFAWVIDGATDVLPEKLTSAPSDASWFAATMHDTIRDMAATPPASLIDVPEIVADRTAPRFAAASKRAPADAGEHPSAAAIVVRVEKGELEYVSLGDCTLIIEDGERWTQIGVDEEDAGDRWVADALQGKSAYADIPKAPLTRADLWPFLRAQRAMMNTPAGYGIFSITAAPRSMIRHGSIPVSAGARILLASDGLLRLVDVFRRYDAKRLFAAAWTAGLAPLFDELRALERADADCKQFPRAKTSDDTTALIARITA